MPRLVITIVLAFLLERATSQVPSACVNATNQYNTSCTGVEGPAICTGECGNATRAFISYCPEISGGLEMTFNATCNNPACNNATIRIMENQRCFNLLDMDTAPTITASDCTACRTLFESAVTVCGSMSMMNIILMFPLTQADIDEMCNNPPGGGGGASALSTLGIHTVLLLFAVIAAVIF